MAVPLEDDSAAAIADCDNNDVERAGFDCIAIAANDVEIEPLEEPPGESAALSVCKEVRIDEGIEPADFQFTVTSGPNTFSFEDNPACEDVPVGPGEYVVSEAPAAGVPSPDEVQVEVVGSISDCIQDPTNPQRATGEIQAGETQECRFFNIYEGDS